MKQASIILERTKQTERPYAMGRRMLLFAVLLVAAVGFRYFTSELIQAGFYVGLLIAYFRSKDEPFWLAFFLTLSSGFMGFFGPYEAMLSVLPGLPPVEVTQFYIILTVIKAFRKKSPYRPFYMGFLLVLLVYIIFLIAQGFAVGFPPGLNRKFALIKVMMPLSLLYSIPILFDRFDQYRQAFKFLFIIALSAFVSQLFSISMGGITPSQFIGATEHDALFMDVSEGLTYRGFFSPPVVIITMLGAMVLIARQSERSNIFPYAVLIANFGSAFLSATRGYVVSFSVMLLLFSLFILKLSPKRILGISLGVVVAFFLVTMIPTVQTQVQNAVDRLTTLEALVEGDVTAGGTLSRISKRGPRVMKVWSESKLTGFGFSEIYREHSDMHVANQTILLHGGIVGLVLLYSFFLYFCYKLWEKSNHYEVSAPIRDALRACVIFFLGWFLIHSSSGQQFGFAYEPVIGMQKALLFGMGSLLYFLAEKQPGKEIAKPSPAKSDKPELVTVS